MSDRTHPIQVPDIRGLQRIGLFLAVAAMLSMGIAGVLVSAEIAASETGFAHFAAASVSTE
jgi:hypothetical protein